MILVLCLSLLVGDATDIPGQREQPGFHYEQPIKTRISKVAGGDMFYSENVLKEYAKQGHDISDMPSIGPQISEVSSFISLIRWIIHLIQNPAII